MTIKIIIEYYLCEIVAYCPEIPYIHQIYDTDVSLTTIIQQIKCNIKERQEIKPIKRIFMKISL